MVEMVGTEKPNPPNHKGNKSSHCSSSQLISHPHNASKNKVLKMLVKLENDYY